MQSNMPLGSKRQILGVGDYTRFDFHELQKEDPNKSR